MRIYLFGGTSEKTKGQQTDILLEELRRLKPIQILSIAFAIKNRASALRKIDELKSNVLKILPETEVLDAENPDDLKKAQNPLIFIGGGDQELLINRISQEPKIMRLIKDAPIVIGSSAGGMILGELLRSSKNDEVFIKGLNIAKNSIVEPHYSEEKRQESLKKAVLENKIQYGIGIDEATAIVFEDTPKVYRTFGRGSVEVITYLSPS